jgi:hypothetical protein
MVLIRRVQHLNLFKANVITVEKWDIWLVTVVNPRDKERPEAVKEQVGKKSGT